MTFELSRALGAPLPLAGEVAERSDAGEGSRLLGVLARGNTLSPALPRKRGRERTVFAATGKSNKAKGGRMRGLRLKPGPLHLAAIVLMHLACMSLIVWLSF
ncbi:hypothetical protein ABIG06_000620 [Bradyrhizobium sp. USDA 326]